MLKLFFEHQDYDIEVAHRGQEAVDKARTFLPNLILLDILLPDIDGYEVFRQIRTAPRTAHIPRRDWALLDIWIKHFDAFREVYGFIAADDVLRFMGMLLTQVMDHLGTEQDFIGHPGESEFIVVTDEMHAPLIAEHLKARFDEDVRTLYNYQDRERGLPDHQRIGAGLGAGVASVGHRARRRRAAATGVAGLARLGAL